MFTRLAVEVQSLGENVELSIGNCHWVMHYTTALLLSVWMRRKAHLAKRHAQDVSQHWRGLAFLHDAEKGPDHGQPFNPLKTARVVVNNLLTREHIDVRQEGISVVVRLRDSKATIPYEPAITIGQWLRVRAKQSKNRAGDTRHWSEISDEQVEKHDLADLARL
jgi:hypothetical protein